MNIVTFNIRCDHKQDGKNNFEYRKLLIRKCLLEKNPDIVCFQEMLPHMALWLSEVLKDYQLVGCGREKDLTGEQMTVAIRKDRFEIISMDTYWLSNTPYLPGSRYEEQSKYPRTATQLLLKETETNDVCLIVNTHLDHKDSRARVQGMKCVLDKIHQAQIQWKAIGKLPAILCGDMNAHPDSPEIESMNHSGIVCDITEEISGTYHNFGKIDRPAKIDYIAVSENIRLEKLELWKDQKNGVFLSDHYPISATVHIQK
ncbi:MAG: endonuclease/exonuclease/phosphatase family protein [Eubacterium sp.]|nr:endonuclease/exonuclease/phosphatase family protein [Eubacterium sp.]